jgi:hypothetical protein
MVIPSSPIGLLAVGVLTILLVFDWFIGGLAYNRIAQQPFVDSLKPGERHFLKEAA